VGEYRFEFVVVVEAGGENQLVSIFLLGDENECPSHENLVDREVMVLVHLSPFEEPRERISAEFPGFEDDLLDLVRTTPHSFDYSSTSMGGDDDPHTRFVISESTG